jgi:hypothetical protein
VAVDVVAITKTAELLLAGGIPDIELDLAQVLYILADCGGWWTCEGQNILW